MGRGGWRPGAGRKPKLKIVASDAETPPRRRHMDFAELMAAVQTLRRKEPRVELMIPEPPPGVLPKDGAKFSLAMDSSINEQINWTNAQVAQPIFAAVANEGLLFLGYAFLSMLAQRAEYRIPTETIATEMTRKWIKFKVAEDKAKKRERHKREDEEAEEELQPSGEQPEEAGEEPQRSENEAPGAEDKEFGSESEPEETAEAEGPEDTEESDAEAAKEEEEEEGEADRKAERVKELEDEFERLRVRDCFKKIAMDDGFFGRAHLFLDFSEDESEINQLQGEMRTDIGDGRNDISKEKVKKNSLKRIKVIEPVWTYPTTYNATNPLDDSWYNPTVWYVMGFEIHASRLLTFVGRPVPDLLKPSYMFGGLSLSQLVKPYVDLWLNTRQNIGNLIQAFSVMVLSTNLTATLQTGGSELFERASLFNQLRDNAGLMVVDKNTEEFTNVSVPLGSLDHLQAQAQEHMMSVVRIPAVKFTGIQPTGLNASSEGEIRTFYDTISAYQESFFRPDLTKLMHFVMLSLWGEIDEAISFDFVALWAMTEKEEAEIRKMEAETDDILVNGVAAIRPEEVRERIANDPDTPYSNLDVEDLPEPPTLQEQGLATGGKVNIKGTQGFGGGPGGKPGGGADGEGGGDAVIPFAGDAEWNESDHPRKPDGKFGSGGGGSGKSNIGESINLTGMKKVGGQMGSNPGGVYEDADGTRFYIKAGKSMAHVRNEMIGAALYDLAGSKTLQYRPVEGGKYIATEMAKLDKDNASKLSEQEICEARKDFAVHAWLANWDATGLGGDNIGMIKGVPVSLDLGGVLDFRAQGAPKGDKFGTKVGEIDTLRSGLNPDAKKVFGGMTPAELFESSRYVTSISDDQIRKAVEGQGGSAALADKMIKRRDDIAAQARRFGAHDVALDANWQESQHPRDPDGKFSEGGGGGGTGSGGGGETPTFKSKKEHVGHLLAKGVTTQEVLKATGWPSISMPQMAKTLNMKLEKYKEGGVTKYKGTPMTKEEIAAAKAAKVAAPQPAPVSPPPPPIPTPQIFPMPTEGELEKAKKTVALQLQYVPGGAEAEPKALAQKLVDKFNEKYANKEMTTQPELIQKVNDFKKLKQEMASLISAGQQAKLNAQAEAKAQQEKQAAAMAEKLKEEKKAAAAKNKEYMDALGISETEAQGFDALVSMMGGGGKDLIAQFQNYEKQAKSHGYPVTGFQYALIRHYINGGYNQVNSVLRAGATDLKYHAYVRLVHNALDKMPKFTGMVTRGTYLTNEQIAQYKPGHVMPEKGFTSTGIGFKFGGNVSYNIKATGKRGADFSTGANTGEKEVLFKAHTFFLCHSVKAVGGTTHIELEEVEGYG